MVDKVFSSEQLNRSLKVLFVDDDVDQCHIYERIFVGRCAVEVAKNTSEARKILAANPGEIAVVVSDMRMPTESGLDFLKYVRENYPSVIRILASAYAEEDTRSALMAINDCGVHKYLQKPIAIESLRAEIKNAIELYLHNTLDTHSAQNVSSLFEEFKDSCDRWTLHNVDLSQELRALDYGLCGIISVYRTRSLNSLSREGADELMHLMDDYVDNIMCSSMLFSQADTKGQYVLNRGSNYKH